MPLNPAWVLVQATHSSIESFSQRVDHFGVVTAIGLPY